MSDLNSVDNDSGKRGTHGLSFKDVQLRYMLDGLDAVKELFLTRKVSPKVLEKAALDLESAGKGSDFASWVRDSVVSNAPGTTHRGRGAPGAGQVRTYKVQLVGEDGAPFIRLPIPESNKGDSVTATFNSDGSITISRV